MQDQIRGTGGFQKLQPACGCWELRDVLGYSPKLKGWSSPELPQELEQS